MHSQPRNPDVVYVLARFPCRSEAFIVRELAGLVALGTRVRVLAVLDPEGDEVDETPAVQVWRRPSWSDPRVWWTVFREAFLRPRAALRALRLACSIGVRESALDVARALRLAALALLVARDLRDDPPTLVHAHFATGPATFAALLGSALECPWGYSTHARDLYAEPVTFAVKTRRSRYVVACSERAADDLRRQVDEIDAGRVHRIHHGLDLQRWSRRPDSAPLPKDTPLILAVGRWEPKKGFDILLEACAQLRADGLDFTCEIIGAGVQQARLHALRREKHLAPHVRLVPWMAQDDLRKRYEQARVLVIPSVVAADGDRDNIPNVLLEALALEVPVVASSLPALEDLLRPTDAARLVPAGDARALAAALREVCEDEALAAQLARAGRELVVRSFDLRKTSRELYDLFAKAGY